MNRAIFPAVTIVLSGLVFATVWTMTDPATATASVPIAAVAIAVTPAIAATPPEAAAPVITRRRTTAMRRTPAMAFRRVQHAAARQETASADIFYPGCRAVRAAGAAPLYRGQPGYRREMDGDGDGIACEPYRGG